MTEDDDIIQFPVRIIGEAGGVVDDSSATLCVYGDDLEPAEVSALLGLEPTDAHRKGHRHGPRSPPARQGAWLLSVRGRAPQEPSHRLRELLARLPNDPAVWSELRSRYTARIFVGVFMEAWNCGFDLPAELMGHLARTGLVVEFDIYADDLTDE
jgi:hypothetical protein